MTEQLHHKTLQSNLRASLKVLSIIFFILVLNGYKSELKAQEEIDFGQYMLFHPTVNIASAGSYYDPTLAIFGRWQWMSIEGSPKSIGAHFLYPLKQNTIGGTITQESEGPKSRQKIMPYFTHKINVAQKKQLAFGLGIGADIIQGRYTQVDAPNETDPSFDEDKTTVGALIGFGTYFYGENYYAGFSIPSIVHNEIDDTGNGLAQKSSFGLQYWHYYFMGGYELFINQITTVNFSSLVKLTSNTKAEIDLNAQVMLLDQLGIGLSYRTKKELLWLVNYNFNNFVRAGYCYHNYFSIEGQPLSGHEIILVIRLAKPKMATIQTPRF